MTFDLLPAIDVAGGRLAVWTAEGVRPLEAHGGDPLSAARSYAASGARRLHVVDMDLAFGTEPANLDVIRAVVAGGLSVQASGGIVEDAHVAAAFDAGADLVVLGSAGFADVAHVERLLDRYGARLVIGLEVQDGIIRARGSEVELDLMETVGWLAAAGASTFLVTSLPRVGVLAGPDVEAVRRVVRAGRRVLAAGGVGSLEDLEAVRAAGAAGAVVGRAAVEGSLDLDTAFAWAAAP